MESLSNAELLYINGGAPRASSDHYVQGGYSIGWHIGHAIGQTIQDIKSFFN